MKNRIRRWLLPWLTRPRVVPLNECVHFCGFRYGRDEINPYENYVQALARGWRVADARARFVDFLCHYRPRHLGEALGIELSRPYPLWQLPWELPAAEEVTSGWVDDPSDAPDILTHFSNRGILRSRVDEEFSWLEEVFYSIQRDGFRPERAGRPVQGCELAAENGDRRYLLLDGNHRVSALVALGEHSVSLRCVRFFPVRESTRLHWPRVQDGSYAPEDARRVFRAYFDGNHRPRTTETAAPVLEH